MFFKKKSNNSQLSFEKKQLLSQLFHIVGKKNIITNAEKMGLFCNGFRYGSGKAIAVVQPKCLLEQWYVLQACVEANVIVIMQAANTGLTGGSTPDGSDYDRDIVIISTMKMKKIILLNDAKQVVCLPGSTLNELEAKIRPFNREPHSVIGSSCIGASVFGGVCNNSGGALVQRGPAYTEMSLFAQYTNNGGLELVNHLGIDLGDTPEKILTRLENEDFNTNHVQLGEHCSDHHYKEHVCQINSPTPARYNADPNHLHEASGCAGKLAVFAVRLDTFTREKDTKTFYIGSNDTAVLTSIRENLLSNNIVPISGEYIHKTAYDIAAIYGKDTFLFINIFGTDYIPYLFQLKNRFDYFAKNFKYLPLHFSDKLMQFMGTLFPQHLPKRMNQYANKYEHYLILKVNKEDIVFVRSCLENLFKNKQHSDYFECTPEESRKAFLQRFAVAGAAVRYRAIHHKTVENILALDIALRRNDKEWTETLPPDIESKCMHKLYYGHFFCHVFHQDYVICKGHNIFKLEEKMLKILDQRGAEYPAEHNVGHLYEAKKPLKDFYQSLDPCNVFNPGIGKTSKLKNWKN